MVATRTDTTLGTNFTQATLFAAIKTAMANAGFSAPIDDYTSGTDRIVIYAFITDATKVYGTTYYRIRVASSLIIYSSLYQNWNTGTHNGANPSNEYSFLALSTNVAVNFTALNGGSEYKFLFITQGTILVPLGVISPAIKPNWWNLNSWNYAFIWANGALSGFGSTALNPYGNVAYSPIINTALMANANPQTNVSDILTGIVILTNTNRGIAGKTSEELGSACAAASSRYNTIATDNINENFLIINPVAGGLVIKV